MNRPKLAGLGSLGSGSLGLAWVVAARRGMGWNGVSFMVLAVEGVWFVLARGRG